MKRGSKSQGELFNMYKYLQGVHKGRQCFSVVPCDRTEDNGHKLKYRRLSLDMSQKKKKNGFLRVIEHWHRFLKVIFES